MKHPDNSIRSVSAVDPQRIAGSRVGRYLNPFPHQLPDPTRSNRVRIERGWPPAALARDRSRLPLSSARQRTSLACPSRRPGSRPGKPCASEHLQSRWTTSRASGRGMVWPLRPSTLNICRMSVSSRSSIDDVGVRIETAHPPPISREPHESLAAPRTSAASRNRTPILTNSFFTVSGTYRTWKNSNRLSSCILTRRTLTPHQPVPSIFRPPEHLRFRGALFFPHPSILETAAAIDSRNSPINSRTRPRRAISWSTSRSSTAISPPYHSGGTSRRSTISSPAASFRSAPARARKLSHPRTSR